MNSISEHHPSTDVRYLERLREKMLLILNRAPARFEHLLLDAEGAYPTDVRLVLKELERSGELHLDPAGVWSTTNDSSVLSKAEAPGHDWKHTSALHSDFPEPHPLDFDWRFADEAIQFLVSQVDVARPGSVAVLGAPTVFRGLVDHAIPAHLFDNNPAVIAYLKQHGYEKVTETDLFSSTGLPRNQHHCVIADPPWYPEHYEAFINASQILLTVGGRFFLSVLPRLTRPGADTTREGILSYATRRGLELVDVIPAALAYVTPPFEKAALESEGFNLHAWRTADLFQFIKKKEVDELVNEMRLEPSNWQTFTLGKVQVRLLPTVGHTEFKMQSPSDPAAWRLRSVSRRSPLRSSINVWTSRNLVLSVSDTRAITTAIQLIQAGSTTKQAVRESCQRHKFSKSESQTLERIIEAIIEDSKEKLE